MENRENCNLQLLGSFNGIAIYHNSLAKGNEILLGYRDKDEDLAGGIGMLFDCTVIDGKMQIKTAYPELANAIISVTRMNFVQGASTDLKYYEEFIQNALKQYES
jgi:hypothetical protein